MMKQLKLGRNLSQPQLLTQNDCFSISTKTMYLDQFQNPPFLPSHTQFQQKYLQQVLDKNLQNQIQKKSLNQQILDSCENSKEGSLQRCSGSYHFDSLIKNSQENIIKYKEKGISFSDYIGDKYQKLNAKQIKMIPPSFVKTFNLTKEGSIAQSQIIKSPKKSKIEFQINLDSISKKRERNIFQGLKNESNTQIQMSDHHQENQFIFPMSEQIVTSKHNVLIDVIGIPKKQKSRIEMNRQALLLNESRKIIKLDQLTKPKESQKGKTLSCNIQTKCYQKKEQLQIKTFQNDEKTEKLTSKNNSQRSNQFQSVIFSPDPQVDDYKQQKLASKKNSQRSNQLFQPNPLVEESKNIIQEIQIINRDFQSEEKKDLNKFKPICQYCCFFNENKSQIDYPKECVCQSKMNYYKKLEQINNQKVINQEQEILLDFMKLRSPQSSQQSFLPQFNFQLSQKSSGSNSKHKKNYSQENKQKFFSSLDKIGKLNEQYIKKIEIEDGKQNEIRINQDSQAKQSNLIQQLEKQFHKKSSVMNASKMKRQQIKSKDSEMSNSQKNEQSSIIIQMEQDRKKHEVYSRLQLVSDDKIQDQIIENTDQNNITKSSDRSKFLSTPSTPKRNLRNRSDTGQKQQNQVISTALKKILQQQREIDEYETKSMIDYVDTEQSLNKKQNQYDGSPSQKLNKSSQFYSSRDSFQKNQSDFIRDPSKKFSINSPKSAYSQSPKTANDQQSFNMQINQIQQEVRARSFSQKINSNNKSEQINKLDSQNKNFDSKPSDSKFTKSKFNEQKEFMTPQNSLNKSQMANSAWNMNSPNDKQDEAQNLNQTTGKFNDNYDEIFNKIGSDGKMLYIPSRIRGMSEIFKKQNEKSQQNIMDSKNESSCFKNAYLEQNENKPNNTEENMQHSSYENSPSIFCKLDEIKKQKIEESSTPSNKGNSYKKQDSFSMQNKSQFQQNESMKNSIYEEIIKKRKERTVQHQELQIRNKQQMMEAFDQKMREQQKQEINTKLAKLRIKHQGSIQLHQQKNGNANSESDISSQQYIEGLIQTLVQEKKKESKYFIQKENNNQIKSSESSSFNSLPLTKKESEQINNENIQFEKELSDVNQENFQNQIDCDQKPEENVSKLLTKRINNFQIQINTSGLFDRGAQQSSFSDLNKNKQEIEKKSSNSALPQMLISLNNEMLSPQNQKSPSRLSFQGSRRVSIFQNVTKEELENQSKCLKTLLNDTSKIVQQFIDKIYCGSQLIKDDEDQHETNVSQSNQKNFLYNLNKKYRKQSATKSDMIQDYTKQLRKVFKTEIVYATELQSILKFYFETCFTENCVPKSEIFVQFKLKKKTIEKIFSVFLFILEENEYPIDIISQAEINLKKNYRLISFLPALHDELGGSNYMNKINLQYSSVLMTRLLDLYKNVEQDNISPHQNQQNDKEEPTEDNAKTKNDIQLSVIDSEISPKQDNGNNSSNQQNRKKMVYNEIESNVENHFEQVFLKINQKKNMMNLESQRVITNLSETNIEQQQQQLQQQQDANVRYKYTIEQIEGLHQQILNLLRFIYHNNSYSQLDMSNMIDKSSIKEICKVFEVNQICFFEIKESMWNTLQEFKVYVTTILRLQEQLEKYRFVITHVPLVDHLLSDSSLYDQITSEMEWRITTSDAQLQGLFENQQTFRAFCHTLVSEIVLRTKSIYNLDVFFKNLNLNLQQFDFISSIFIKSISHIGFDHSFCKDAEIKFLKIKYKLDLYISPLKLIGGQSGLRKIIEGAHQMIINPAYENEYAEYVKKFPEDLHNLLYEIPANLNSTKYNRRPGLQFLEYIMLSLFSFEDCYSIQDLRAGVQTFNIAKTTPIHWKSLLEYSMNNLKYSQSTIKIVIQEMNTQFQIVFIDLSE